MNGGDAQTFPNISAPTGSFSLEGGLYQFTATTSTWNGGNVSLQILCGDGVTWVKALTMFSSNGGEIGYCGPGTYRVNVVLATAVYAVVCRVPS